MKSDRDKKNESAPIPVAQSVGNYIRDQALVLSSTRIHRYSVKYRDAVVSRLLSGRTTISSLTADGQFTESELISWIADKAKRQSEKSKDLELEIDADSVRNNHRDRDGSGPFAPR